MSEKEEMTHREVDDTTKTIQDLDKFQNSIRNFFNSFNILNLISEHNHVVAIDTRVPIHVAIRSLFEYKKLFVVIYDHESQQLCGIFDTSQMVDYSLHLISYLLKKKHDDMQSDTFPQQQTVSNSTFAPKSSSQQNLCVTSESPHVISPWLYTLQNWIQISSNVPKIQWLTIYDTAMEAMFALLKTEASVASIWTNSSYFPLSFVSRYSLISHLVRNLHGNYNLFDFCVRKHLQIGTYSNFVTITKTTTFLKALQTLRKHSLSVLPVVDNDGVFVSCFSYQHLMQAYQMAFHGQFSIDPLQEVHKICEKLNVLQSNNASVPYTPEMSSNSANDSPQIAGSDRSSSTPRRMPPNQIPSTILKPDITLREAIVHILSSEEQRIIFLDPERRYLVGIVTIDDICKFLVGWNQIKTLGHFSNIKKQEVLKSDLSTMKALRVTRSQSFHRNTYKKRQNSIRRYRSTGYIKNYSKI